MFIRWFSNYLVRHPYVILFSVSLVSGTCLILPFILESMSLPSFQDPQLGFSTRGTIISNRLAAYSNLMKATRPSGKLIINPKEYLMTLRNETKTTSRDDLIVNRRRKNEKRKKPRPSVIYGNVTNELDPNAAGKALAVDKWKVLQNLSGIPLRNDLWPNIHAQNFFCGGPDDRYAHFVVKSTTDEDLLSLANLLSLCRLERRFTELKHYEDLCILNTKSATKLCCNPWSLPNFIAALRQKPSCLGITKDDIDYTRNLLLKCAHHFHNLDLKCLRDVKFCDAPIECIRHDAVFNILNYLVTSNFLTSTNPTADEKMLPQTMVFLPMASSIAIVPYYHEFEKHMKEVFEGLHVVAVDFGIKSALFDEYLISDGIFMILGGDFIFFCIWIYTKSLFLTTMTITVIVYSLAISYFMYFMVYNIKFFPFMNVLAAVVILGIGSDDAFIFCKVWSLEKRDRTNNNNLETIMGETFRHAVISMFVTALTTGVAFLGSYISTVTAISCFSIFAGTAVVVNYVLMMTLFPACMIIWERQFVSNSSNTHFCKTWLLSLFHRCPRLRSQWNFSAAASWLHIPEIGSSIVTIWKGKKMFLINAVIKLRYIWIASLSALGIAGVIAVFVYPRIELPNTTEFQLFSAAHVFEQFDFIYKQNFWFNKQETTDVSNEYKIPIRFVWGVLPIDNGDHLNPSDYGTAVMDPNFDIADPEAQEWLRNFCLEIKQQAFFHSGLGPLLSNCFIETFEKSMRRPCTDTFTGRDRSPCCEITKFPFNRTIFNRCAIEEIAEVLKTPSEFLGSNVAGPKFSKDQNSTIKALVIEYDSNYTFSLSYEELNKFYTTVETWTQAQLATAPATLKNGFFTSDLEFYDLQRELSRGTINAVLVSMGLAFVVLFLSTLNIITSVLAIITILFSILVTMATIAIMGWRLNILESLAISTAIGLTVDFSLHYSINYRLCPEEVAVNREASTRYALSYMIGPALMVALTTGAAGGFMTFSFILPYMQIGVFLIIVMAVSWIYATFFLGALLATIGPTHNQYQYSYSSLLCCLLGKSETSNDCSRPDAPTSSISDSHELDTLTLAKQDLPTPKPLRRSLSAGGARFTPSKYAFTDQSPSATSAITIIMADDN